MIIILQDIKNTKHCFSFRFKQEKSTIPAFEKKGLSQSRIIFINQNNIKKRNKTNQQLKLKIQRKNIISESLLVQMISEKYDMLKDDADDNTAYHHIQLSIVKLQEQVILGQI
ncbi:unnamed protein product (macronuclear) [Paramecium tetraurelia]|uniref:Uncharacterized protein n=1 Tax=Paramecium tetraurelia TaxID=5888 RepID=A0D9C7_PARTE|nr:uncharacterized protein GSPATT00014574001 [Paramecium tetraurelia]CAK79644.1 unnamed protein product [Paramecium tetraurelia]|eukprot:XP_001447041.1 hypothetical protein (macronuclear) [Paramecium tetraurelia strain d4-2]